MKQSAQSKSRRNPPSDMAYTFQYDGAGRRERITYPSGHYTHWSYDTAGRLTTVGSHTSTGTVVARDHLLLDDAGSILGDEIDNGLSGGRTFGNDALDRLVSVTTSAYGGGAAGLFGGLPAVTYHYDTVGNRTSVVTGSTTTYTPAANPKWNEYASVGGVACGYDARHCLTSDGTRTMGYDADNRLTSVSKGGTVTGLSFHNHAESDTLTCKGISGCSIIALPTRSDG